MLKLNLTESRVDDMCSEDLGGETRSAGNIYVSAHGPRRLGACHI